MACQLKSKLKFTDFVIFERSAGLGGTWRSNTCQHFLLSSSLLFLTLIDPGCGVDVPAVLYSLSFAPNPNFSRLFPDQEEILSYLEKLAVDFDIYSTIKYDVSWESAKWQQETSTWHLNLRVGQTGEMIEHECKILISAVGRLVIPNSFQMPGTEDFQGQIVHSARWKSDITVKDKSVVVVGNGCKYMHWTRGSSKEEYKLTLARFRITNRSCDCR